MRVRCLSEQTALTLHLLCHIWLYWPKLIQRTSDLTVRSLVEVN